MLFTMLAAAKPTTIAITQNRTSLAIDTAEGDMSMECFMFKGAKAMACRTPTSERSMSEQNCYSCYLTRCYAQNGS